MEKEKAGIDCAREHKEQMREFDRLVGRALKQVREEKNISQKTLAGNVGLAQSTISWLEGEGPKEISIFRALAMCTSLSITMDDLFLKIDEQLNTDNNNSNVFREWIKKYSENIRGEMKKQYISKKHLSRLMLYEKNTYVIYYMHYDMEGKSNLSKLYIKTKNANEEGYCPFKLSIEGKKAIYNGRMYSPLDGNYTYFHFSGGIKTENGLIITYHPPNLEKVVKCGVGIMLSIDRITQSPMFQRIKYIDKKIQGVDEGTIKEMLTRDMFLDRNCILKFPNFPIEHQELYKKFVGDAKTD